VCRKERICVWRFAGARLDSCHPGPMPRPPLDPKPYTQNLKTHTPFLSFLLSLFLQAGTLLATLELDNAAAAAKAAPTLSPSPSLASPGPGLPLGHLPRPPLRTSPGAGTGPGTGTGRGPDRARGAGTGRGRGA